MRIKRLSLLLFNSILSVFKILPFIFKRAKDGQSKVVIRFDDYGVWCNSDWITIEEEVIRLHEKYGVKISFGVVPDSKYPLISHPLSPSVYPKEYEDLECNPYPLVKGSKRVELLKDSVKKGVSEVALHGYTHPKGYSNTINTEFLGLSYDLQYDKLQQGRNKLEELFESKIRTFIPPHNTYDKLTLDLLYDLNFSCVSGCYAGVLSPRCDELGFNYLWFKYDDVSVLLKELNRKKHYKYEPIKIIMLHHTNFTTDGKIDEKKLNEYGLFLKIIHDRNIANYCFSNVPDTEVKLFDEVYYLEKDNVFLRLLRKFWPAASSNYIEYNLNSK